MNDPLCLFPIAGLISVPCLIGLGVAKASDAMSLRARRLSARALGLTVSGAAIIGGAALWRAISDIGAGLPFMLFGGIAFNAICIRIWTIPSTAPARAIPRSIPTPPIPFREQLNIALALGAMVAKLIAIVIASLAALFLFLLFPSVLSVVLSILFWFWIASAVERALIDVIAEGVRKGRS